MNSPAIDIKDYLLAKSAESTSDLELVYGTNLFVSILPETNNLCAAIMDTPGSPPEPNNIRMTTVQVLVRGKQGQYETAWDFIERIVNELHEVSNVAINSTSYLQIWKFGDIHHAGNDEKTRPVFSCTLAIQRT